MDHYLDRDHHMAFLDVHFYSEALELSTSMSVLLPQQPAPSVGSPDAAGGGLPPVLYLLHGLSDDDTIWMRRTNIERYVAPLGMAVVMPQVHRSFYSDEVQGSKYWTFLSEELPQLVASMFRVSDRPQDTYVAGLSMGGFGAMKWALRKPERFAAAASLSGVLDLVDFLDTHDELEDNRMRQRIFGSADVRGSGDDLISLIRAADPATLPQLSVICGTEDFLVEGNRTFLAAAAEAGIVVDSEFPAGDHEWGFWDSAIQRVLESIKVQRSASSPDQ